MCGLTQESLLPALGMMGHSTIRLCKEERVTVTPGTCRALQGVFHTVIYLASFLCGASKVVFLFLFLFLLTVKSDTALTFHADNSLGALS